MLSIHFRVYVDKKDLNISQVEDVIKEKLDLIESNPEEHHDEKVKELWDDIQILAFMEKKFSNIPKSTDAVTLLQKFIGDEKSEELKAVIKKVNLRQKPLDKTYIKMTPSYINEKKGREYTGKEADAKKAENNWFGPKSYPSSIYVKPQFETKEKRPSDICNWAEHYSFILRTYFLKNEFEKPSLCRMSWG